MDTYIQPQFITVIYCNAKAVNNQFQNASMKEFHDQKAALDLAMNRNYIFPRLRRGNKEFVTKTALDLALILWYKNSYKLWRTTTWN